MSFESRKLAVKFMPALPARVFLIATIFALSLGADERPNILWITAEDHGPHMGCYGDDYATTPNLDRFAERSLRYTRAISTAPVCAPARTTLVSGMYAPSLGAQHMRSQASIPEWLVFYPEVLRAAGYYCTNNRKTDYNFKDWDKIRDVWDESSGEAHWKNRPEGMPFFAIFNTTSSHESQIRNENEAPLHDPALVPIPPYHPDTPESRKDWAQYYDRLTKVDAFFAERMKELEEAGLVEDTIVFYYSDHGSGMPRSKRYPGWSGLNVPLLVHIPEKFMHLAPPEYREGGVSDRLVGFVDMGATLCNLIGVEIPEVYQGEPFLGEGVSIVGPAYNFGFMDRKDEKPDVSRVVMDQRYVYTRNYLPYLPHGQYLEYQQQTPTTATWNALFDNNRLDAVQSAFWLPHPAEELFDTLHDPHSTRNLAKDPAYQQVVQRFRTVLNTHLLATRDAALMPEPFMKSLEWEKEMTPGDLLRNDQIYPLQTLLDFADLALCPGVAREAVLPYFHHESPLVRYWAAQHLLGLSPSLYLSLEEKVEGLLGDSERIVRLSAAQAIAYHSKRRDLQDAAVEELLIQANNHKTNMYFAMYALNSLALFPADYPVPYDRFLEVPRELKRDDGWNQNYSARVWDYLKKTYGF